MSTGTTQTNTLHARFGHVARAFSIATIDARRRLLGPAAEVAVADPRADFDAACGELPSAYQLLVSRQDRRYHAVWDNEVFRIAHPARHSLPTAVCGVGGCEPFDESSMAPPRACDSCFLWLREFAPTAECIGAPRRNLAALSDTTANPAGLDAAGPPHWPSWRAVPSIAARHIASRWRRWRAKPG